MKKLIHTMAFLGIVSSLNAQEAETPPPWVIPLPPLTLMLGGGFNLMGVSQRMASGTVSGPLFSVTTIFGETLFFFGSSRWFFPVVQSGLLASSNDLAGRGGEAGVGLGYRFKPDPRFHIFTMLQVVQNFIYIRSREGANAFSFSRLGVGIGIQLHVLFRPVPGFFLSAGINGPNFILRELFEVDVGALPHRITFTPMIQIGFDFLHPEEKSVEPEFTPEGSSDP